MGVLSLPVVLNANHWGGGLLLLGNGKSPDSLLASPDLTPSGRDEALHYYHVGVEVQAPHLVSTDIAEMWGRPSYQQQGCKSQIPMWPFSDPIRAGC